MAEQAAGEQLQEAAARAIAFYLPQFHPIPQNDEWWGKGFTEWTNTAKAKPLFPGHYQPHVPADLGFYDLRLPEARAQQAALARRYGVEGFCYYHYWFGGGRRILERVFEEVLASGEPDFPFCLCWANQSWSGRWHGAPDQILIEQTYPDRRDAEAHFDWLARAFADPRYIRVDGRPLFLIFEPASIPSVARLLELWRARAEAAGLPGLYLVAVRQGVGLLNPHQHGFDASVTMRVPLVPKRYVDDPEAGAVLDHEKVVDLLVAPEEPGVLDHPCVSPNWDNSPRLGRRGLILHNSRPELFLRNVRTAMGRLAARPPQERLLFVKAWNEWGEGNHLEPDLKFGHAWLQALKDGMAAGPPAPSEARRSPASAAPVEA